MSNFFKTWSKWLPYEVIIFTKFHKDWTKIVDFLLMANFWKCPFFCVRLYAWWKENIKLNLHFNFLLKSILFIIFTSEVAIIKDCIRTSRSWPVPHKVWGKKMGHTQKLAINKKSTIFALSLWNLVKIITSWGNHFHQVSWG